MLIIDYLKILEGNKNIALMNSRIPFTANPRILKGRVISQMMGYKKRRIMATGQQITSKRNQIKMPIKFKTLVGLIGL